MTYRCTDCTCVPQAAFHRPKPKKQVTERLSDGPMDGPTETDGQTNGRIEGWTEYLTDMPGRL